jgi:ABC-type transport system involved in multi-copper enzyme maturation permease subunit
MRNFYANLEEVFREAAARWTLIAYFVLSTVFIIIFASAMNLDVVNGSLAGAKLFGKDLHVDHTGIDQAVQFIEMGIAGAMYLFATLLGLFATAHLVPRMQEKGTIDLYLSRPVGRVKLLLSRYVSGLILAAVNIIYIFGSTWVILIWKTHVVHGRFWLGALTIFFTIAVLMAFNFLVGVITSSTAVSLMGGFALYVFGAILHGHDHIAAALSWEWAANLIQSLYWILPKTGELGSATVLFVTSGGEMMRHAESVNYVPVFLTSAAFGIGSLALAATLFKRRDF